MEPKRVYRSRTDRVLGGVCSGLGKYFGLDPVLLRVLWAIAFFIGGAGLLAYIIAWIIIPEEPVA
jgi:phage shock protein PspC (stress-responsive transcriptional regulator)